MDEQRLIEQYRSPVLYFILKRVRERSVAEELTQETLLILLQTIRENRLQDESSLGAYVFGIARNLIFKNYRTHAREADPPDPESEAARWIQHPEAELFLEEERNRVRRALSQMSDQDREILHLSFLETDEPENMEQVASRLGIPYAAARKRKSRALERLRKILLAMSQKERP